MYFGTPLLAFLYNLHLLIKKGNGVKEGTLVKIKFKSKYLPKHFNHIILLCTKFLIYILNYSNLATKHGSSVH